jgi:hypothetical protein
MSHLRVSVGIEALVRQTSAGQVEMEWSFLIS